MDDCPISNKNTDVYDTYCRNENQSRTFANYVPIVARGIPYLNVYCAACHGVMLKDVNVVTRGSTVLCQPKSLRPENPLFHFYPSFICKSVEVKYLDKYTKLVKRITENCVNVIDPPMRYCTCGNIGKNAMHTKLHTDTFSQQKMRLVLLVI